MRTNIPMLKKVFAFIVVVLTVFAISFQYSRKWENSFFVEPLSRLNTQEKIIALTFDDGPSRERTVPLLELLKKYNVKATFFMVGEKIKEHPEIAKQVYEEGHTIGNHSYDHSRLIFKRPSFIRNQIEKTDELIQSLGQTKVELFRPPYSSKFLVLPYYLSKKEKTLVTGSYDPPSQYLSPLPKEEVAKEVSKNLSSGSIIYLHDGKESDGKAFVETVEQIILSAQNEGYEFVAL